MIFSNIWRGILEVSLLNGRVNRKIFGLVFFGLLLVNSFWFAITTEPVYGSPELTLKWQKNLGGRAKTTIAPLSANLVGDDRLEIVVVGGSSYGGDDGTVTVLDGETGDVMWQVAPGGIGMHSAFDIVDLNKDGIPEIIISAKNPLALHGNDGSVYWRNTKVPAGDQGLYNAIYDIDGDGYPTIFVSSGQAPFQGYDYVTSLSYDGKILHQAWCWHSCYGGLTVSDANYDGRFELYQADRSSSFNPDDNPYQGGGMGLRCLDAHTLTPLWNDPTILCSSQCPILADVDKDGILDVIVADQGSSGIAVLNSADGSVVTTGGKYRKGGTQMPAHSQPTVYDIDGDGNLELIDCRSSSPKIWDLYDWKLDATLPVTCYEPPKVGDVTGDGEMDIIAVADSALYIYDKTYHEVDSVTGLISANAFTLVQDVDGDALNELVVTSQSGYVYCYDTSAPAPNPRTRSGLQFYSEYKCGAAEYVSPPTPLRPALSDEHPRDGSLNQVLNPTLSILAGDYQGSAMDITFRTNVSGTWEDIFSYTSVGNGVYTATITNMDSYGTTYYWSVNATDTVTGFWNHKIYSFTTYSNPPTHIEPILVSSGRTNGFKEDLICYNQTTIDPEADEVTNIYNWYVNDDSLTSLLLPFDTRPDTSGYALLIDGFEDDFDKWDEDGWDRTTGQAHSGSWSAHAGSTAAYLTSEAVDTSIAGGFTVSFWYRDDDIDDNDNVYLQFWNGSTYNNIFELGNTNPEDEWHHYSVWWRPIFQYAIRDFHIRFSAGGIGSGENLWVDDVSIRIDAGSGRAKDYSDYDNHGSVEGATWTSEGVVGGAYEFDGDDYIRIHENSDSLGGDGSWSEISVEFWVKATTNTGTERLMWKHNATDTGEIGYRVDFRAYSTRNYVRWRVYTPSTLHSIYYNIYGGARSWHHVVCTYKSGVGLKIYVDGTERKSLVASGNIQATGDGPLAIGYYSGSGDFSGVLDEVRIYPKALSPFQVSMRYLETESGLSSNSTIAWQETEVGDEWRCEVTPNDGFGDGESKFSNTLLIHEDGNTPPVAGNLAVSPPAPLTSDDLIASYDYYDADGDPEYGTEIMWYKDGELQPDLAYSLTVPSSLTAKGQAWYFTVRPKDAIEFGDLQTSPSITILNTPPSFTDVYITPEPAFDTSTLTANPYGWFDDDDDPEGYVYQWQKLIIGSWQDIIGETSQTLDPAHFDRGDTIRVNCTAYDGEDLGTSYLDTVWIVDSDPPMHGDPLLVSSYGGDKTDEELICYNQTTTDPEGDEVTNIYRWIRNGDSITSLLMPFDTNSSATATDYSGYGNEGTVFGAAWTNDGVVGGAYEFDGDDVIIIPDDPSLGGTGTWSEISVEFWVKPSALVRGTRILARKIGSASTGSYMVGFQTNAPDPYNTLFWGITSTDDGAWHDISDADDWSEVRDRLALEADQWYHVFCTYRSGPGLTIYLNGVEQFNMPLTGNIDYDADEQLFLGYDGGGTANRYLNGALDEVRIYPTALTPAYIFQRYIETKDGLSKSSTIVPQETTAGEEWSCEVIPNDSWQDGTAKTSDTLTVLPVSGNSRPRIDVFTPTETTQEINAGESLEFTQVSSDPDGDLLSYSWLLDDVEQATSQNWTYPPDTAAGTHNVTLAVDDGEFSDSQQWTVTVISIHEDAYLVVRGLDNRIWYRIYNSSSSSWDSWNFVPDGLTCDSPAATVCCGKLHIVVRGFSATDVYGNYSLWHVSVDLSTGFCSGWTKLSGSALSTPTLAASDALNRLYLVIRGLDNHIWYMSWNGTDWGEWNVVPSGATCDGPAATVLGDDLHVVVRGINTTTLWHYYMSLSTGDHSAWTIISGGTLSAPTLTS